MYTKVQNAFTSRYLCYCTNKNNWNSIIYYNHEQKRQLHTFENPYRVRNLRETSKTQQLSFIAFYQFVLKLPAVFTKAKQTTYFNFKQENTFQICNFGIFLRREIASGHCCTVVLCSILASTLLVDCSRFQNKLRTKGRFSSF